MEKISNSWWTKELQNAKTELQKSFHSLSKNKTNTYKKEQHKQKLKQFKNEQAMGLAKTHQKQAKATVSHM